MDTCVRNPRDIDMIKSNKFGGVLLSGHDAEKFDRQVKFGRAPASAQETLNLGYELLQRFGGGVASDIRSEPATDVKTKSERT
jgi:hypothetical protein